MIAYVAHYKSGHPAPWSVSSSARECRKSATSGMMGADEYDELGSTSARWMRLYRQGCRIRKYVLREVV